MASFCLLNGYCVPGTVLSTLYTLPYVKLMTTLCIKYNDYAYSQVEIVRLRESERLSKLPKVTHLMTVAFPHVK